jgi:hypothetical protein
MLILSNRIDGVQDEEIFQTSILNLRIVNNFTQWNCFYRPEFRTGNRRIIMPVVVIPYITSNYIFCYCVF